LSPHALIQHDKKIQCVLLHDHVLLREGLRRLLEDEPDIEVVAEAGNAAEALRILTEHRPHVVITDAHIFECEADESERRILAESPESKVLFLTSDDGEVAPSRTMGDETTYAMRGTSSAELLEMVRRAAAAEKIPVLDARRRGIMEWRLEEFFPRQRVLTARERQVLKLLAEGRTVRSAATILGLSVKTVDAHKFNLMRKLGLHNKAELVMWAIQKRVVKLPVNL
jgi:DNA-binding NarL/FixJ family response regulator